MEFFYYSSSKHMKLHKVVDLRLANYYQNREYLRVLSWDLQVFIEMNKYIFVVVRSKVSNMQIKKKVHAWADLDPPPPPPCKTTTSVTAMCMAVNIANRY